MKEIHLTGGNIHRYSSGFSVECSSLLTIFRQTHSRMIANPVLVNRFITAQGLIKGMIPGKIFTTKYK